MDRRDLLSGLGVAASGLAIGGLMPPDAEAAEHGGKTPVERFHLYLCASHIAKKDPKFQIEAHHYCSMVSEELHQCVIFDKVGNKARVLGVEYIISERLSYPGM